MRLFERTLPFSLTPDQQFQALVLAIALSLVAWRMEPEAPAVPAAPALAQAAEMKKGDAGWRWIASAQAGELDAGPPAVRGRLERRDLPPTGAEDYAVQLGVYASWHNALRAARELRGRSLRPELVLEDGPKPVLRLVVGHFATRPWWPCAPIAASAVPMPGSIAARTGPCRRCGRAEAGAFPSPGIS